MKREVRTLAYDDGLHIEAYRFEGIVRPFPNHFHEYYVFGCVEEGERALSCRNREYTVKPGDILLFNPGDSHACVQSGGSALDYRGLNITQGVMLDLAEEVTGRRELPGFSRSMIADQEAACCLRPLHESVMNGGRGFGKEENLLLLISLLMQRYGQPFEACVPECRDEIERACAFMERHYAERICLEQICRRAGLSRSALLSLYQVEGRYALQLSGKYPRWGGEKAAGAGRPAGGGGLADRVLRPEPFHQLFQPVYRPDAGRVSGDFQQRKGQFRWTCKIKNA